MQGFLSAFVHDPKPPACGTQLARGRHCINTYWLNFIHEAINTERVRGHAFHRKTKLNSEYTSYPQELVTLFLTIRGNMLDLNNTPKQY